MTSENLIIEPAWDKTALNRFEDGLDAKRRREDRRALQHLFNEVAKSAEGRAALEWARTHNISYIVDRETDAYGYYWTRTGTVAIAAAVLTEETAAKAVSVFVHETRHAWQDYYGMLPTQGTSFADIYTKIALLEADAEAHGDYAMREYTLQVVIDSLQPGAPAAKHYQQALDELPQRKAEIIWDNVKGWYGSWRAESYGRGAAHKIASNFGIPNIEPDDPFMEFKPYKDGQLPPQNGLDFTRPEQLRRLGKSFSGKNYFDLADRHTLTGMLSPGLAARFFDAAKAPIELVTEINRRQLRLKQHKKQQIILAA